MTALPIIETQDGDVSAYIPTNVISITDGQIFLQSELSSRVSARQSTWVSRFPASVACADQGHEAGRRQPPSGPRFLSGAAGFTQFGCDLDEATQKQLTHGARMTELLKQPRYKPFEVGEQIVAVRWQRGLPG